MYVQGGHLCSSKPRVDMKTKAPFYYVLNRNFWCQWEVGNNVVCHPVDYRDGLKDGTKGPHLHFVLFHFWFGPFRASLTTTSRWPPRRGRTTAAATEGYPSRAGAIFTGPRPFQPAQPPEPTEVRGAEGGRQDSRGQLTVKLARTPRQRLNATDHGGFERAKTVQQQRRFGKCGQLLL